MKAHRNVHKQSKFNSRTYSPKTVAIARALPGLGDFLCAVPAMRALRMALPEAEITLIGLPQTQKLVKRFSHLLNRWLEFPGYPGIPEVPLSPADILSSLSDRQRWQFDLVLQMHGSGLYMNGFVSLLNATHIAGFFPVQHYCPNPDSFIPYPDGEPEIWRHLHLLEFLGIPLQGTHIEFPLWESDWQELSAIANQYHLHWDRYICIHPGASVSDRRWHGCNFAAVADALAAQGWQIVLTGTTTEAGLTNAIAQAMHFPAIDLAGQTSLGGLAALLQNSRLLICNDTGVSHLAAALQVKSIVLFSNSDPQRWAPLDRQRHRIVQVGSTNQGREIEFNIAQTNPIGMSTPSSDVLSAAIALLNQETAYVS